MASSKKVIDNELYENFALIVDNSDTVSKNQISSDSLQ